MTVPTAAELTLLNSHPQMTKLYLSIYQPDTVLSFQITGSASKGDTTLNGTTLSGSHLLVESEVFTALVGTTLGGDEKGKIRVRSATANTIIVPINSHVNWANGDYITVLRYVEINPVYQRIIQDPADPMNTLWYKYSDIAYSNQNTVLGSFICMGGHYAGFLDGGQCNVYYSASGTYNLKSEAMSFNWFFQGATTTGSAVHTPGYIAYSTPGHYMTKLTVTTSGSASDMSYRFVSIYDRPEAGAVNPIIEWELIDLSGNRDAGGYTASIRVRGTAYENVVRDGALVVIHAEDWYTQATKQSIGGNALNRSSIFFSGYILNGTIQYNYQDGYVEFEIGSPTGVMKSMEGFAIDVTSSTNPASQAASDPNYPSGWVLLLNMDGRRAIYHYLRWHSTVLYCTDFDVNYFGTDLEIEHFTSDRTSIYDAVNTLMQSTYVGEVVSDRQGRIFAEVTVQGTNNASGSFATAMEIEKRHWIETPMIDERQIGETSFLEMGGIKYNGPVAGTFNAFLSCAPGNEPALRGKIEQAQGLALASQAQLNALVGNVFAYRNSRYPNIDLRLAGNYRHLDIAPQQLTSLSIAQTDTPRGVVFNKKPFTIRNMNWTFDAASELLLPSMAVAEVTQGFAGDTITIPPVPPVSGGGPGGGGFDVPPIIVPPLPIILPVFDSTPIFFFWKSDTIIPILSVGDLNFYDSTFWLDPQIMINGFDPTQLIVRSTGWYNIFAATEIFGRNISLTQHKTISSVLALYENGVVYGSINNSSFQLGPATTISTAEGLNTATNITVRYFPVGMILKISGFMGNTIPHADDYLHHIITVEKL